MKNSEYRKIAEKARADFRALPLSERAEFRANLWSELRAARMKVQELEAQYKGVATS